MGGEDLESKVKKIFLICPVRDQNSKEGKILKNYIAKLESQGHKVHYPPRDTNQIDNIGYRICSDNMRAISNADEVHIYWNPASKGSLFDLGMTFYANKPIKLINYNEVKAYEKEEDSKKKPGELKKSFGKVLMYLHEKYDR